MRYIDEVIIHHSASDFGNAATIEKWHTDPSVGFDSIGYHYVICNGFVAPQGIYNEYVDGLIETGRSDSQVGAHCRGKNGNSIGVCLIGNKGDFSHKQYI